MDSMPKAELAEKPSLFCNHNGFSFLQDPQLANGWVSVHGKDGNVLAMVADAHEVHVARWPIGPIPIMRHRVSGSDAADDDDMVAGTIHWRPDHEAELKYAQRLATHLWETHWKVGSPHWKPLPTLMGVLTQIDNMIANLKPPKTLSDYR